MNKAANPPFVIFANQLFPTLFDIPAKTAVYLIEDPFHFSPAVSVDLLIFYRAALQAVREQLLLKGHRVEYLDTATHLGWQDLCKSMKNAHVRHIQQVRVVPTKARNAWNKALAEHGITATVLPNNGWKGKLEKVASSELPRLWHPQPNRYVEEARVYATSALNKKVSKSTYLTYPVTHADAEDYLADFLRKRLWMLEQKKTKPFTTSDLPLLLASGLLVPAHTKKAAKEFAKERQVPKTALTAFLRLLA